MKLKVVTFVSRPLSMVPVRTNFTFNGFKCLKVSSTKIMDENGKIYNVNASQKVLIKG